MAGLDIGIRAKTGDNMTTISQTESQVFAAVRAYVLWVLGANTVVIQAPGNRVPMPKTDFILLNYLNRQDLTRPVESYFDETVGTIQTSTISYDQALEYGIQVDCYGANAGDNCSELTAWWDTATTCDFLETYNIQPLYHDDPRMLPLVDSESQYTKRWTTSFYLQYNPSVTMTQQFADEVDITLIEVDTTYTP